MSFKKPNRRKKVCSFCQNKDSKIDYKDVKKLQRFLSERGKILPRRVSGVCAKHQRKLTTEVKRARIMSLIPFVKG